MLTQLCQYLRNWFVIKGKVACDKFTVAGGTITARRLRLSDFLQEGQYYRLEGSVFNDGVHQYGAGDLQDEQEFAGTISAMAIPQDVIALDAEISQWIADNAGAINSPFQSESFGGYSYSKGYAGGEAQGVTWQGQFAARLAQWRKIS